MEKHLAVILLVLLVFSCKEKSERKSSNAAIENIDHDAKFNVLKTDFSKWWAYHYHNISLSSNFTGINEYSDTIRKAQFLEKLISGKYIPLKLNLNEGSATYKLFGLDSLADESIGSTIKNEASIALEHYNMEGQVFPEFDFTDLKNNHYTNENTRGKTMILKTWFIGCTACVAEFPELNDLVEKYEHRNDMVFVSLALDSPSKLEAFLSRKSFKYGVVPNQGDFIVKKLKSQIYPTHIIIDQNGLISKVTNRASEMITFLDHGKLANNKVPPPPPTM